MSKPRPINSSYGLVELRRARRAGLRLIWAVSVFSVFVNALMLTGPLFMLQVYDRVLGSRSEETLVALFLLVGALFALMAVLDYARGRVLARYGARFQDALDERVFSAIMRRGQSVGKSAAPTTGLRDVEALQSLYTSPAMTAFFDVPWTPVFVAAIFIFHPLLGWLAVAGGTALVVITLLNYALTRRRSLEARTASQQAHSLADETRALADIVRSQGMSTVMSSRWRMLRSEALNRTLRASDWTGLFSSLTKAFRLFLQSAMLALGAWLVLRGELTAGAMIAASILLGRALAPIEQSIGQWQLVQRARAGWRALGDLLENVAPEDKRTTLPKPEARLSIISVTIVTPETGHPILRNFSMEVSPGQSVGIIGKSGAGKSTLARAIMGLAGPAAGEVRLGGATLDQYGPDDLGAYVGYLPQDVTLFNGTVAENIARMSLAPDDAKVIAAAKRANAHELILSLSDGYETHIQARDPLLSGGQRQRIALARALYGDPVLLVLDEPNSALDADGSMALNTAIRDFKRSDRAVVVMTHRPMAIAECDRLVVVDGGIIKAEGPRDDVLRSMLKNSDEVQKSLQHAQGG